MSYIVLKSSNGGDYKLIFDEGKYKGHFTLDPHTKSGMRKMRRMALKLTTICDNVAARQEGIAR